MTTMKEEDRDDKKNTSCSGRFYHRHSAAAGAGYRPVLSELVFEGGQLYTWGRGGQGQLGQEKVQHPKPNCGMPYPVKDMNKIVHVAVGEGQQGCVLCTKADGTLWTFGNNTKGRLGLGSPTPRFVSKPTLVQSLQKAKHFVISSSCGERHSGCLTREGLILMWGYNGKGSLGDGTCEDRLEPVQVIAAPVASKVGSSKEKNINYLKDIVSLDCSNDSTAAIATTTHNQHDHKSLLYTWGDNTFGRLGWGKSGKEMPFSHTPGMIVFNDDDSNRDGENEGGGGGGGEGSSTTNKNYPLQVSVGSLYSGCVMANGSLYMWGYGGHGNLGVGDRKTYKKPQRLRFFGAAKAPSPLSNDQKNDGEEDEEKKKNMLTTASGAVCAVQVACTKGQAGCKGGYYPKKGGNEGPHTLVVSGSGDIFSFGTCHKGLLGNLGDKTGAFGKPWDALTPYRMGDAFANGKLTTTPRSKFAIAPPYDKAGPFAAVVSAHIHCAAINTKGEAWAWGCGSNDGRCGVQRFLNGPGNKVDSMKCYMMGPHRVGIATKKFWAFGSSLKDKDVFAIATGRNTMACIVYNK